MTDPRETKVLSIFEKHGAVVVDGHGQLVDSYATVPKGTAIMFLAETGKCMNITTGLGIQNKFFTSVNGLINFMKSGRGPNGTTIYHHVSDILSKTFFEGDRYIDMDIHLKPDRRYASMGFMKVLPTGPSHEVPLFKNLIGPIKPGVYRLSDLLKTKKGGVFIVSACRVIPNAGNRSYFNLAPFQNDKQSHIARKSTNSLTQKVIQENYRKPKRGHVAGKTLKADPIINKRKPSQTSRTYKTVVVPLSKMRGTTLSRALVNLKVGANFIEMNPKLSKLFNTKLRFKKSGVGTKLRSGRVL
jgi:hypothetical protein